MENTLFIHYTLIEVSRVLYLRYVSFFIHTYFFQIKTETTEKPTLYRKMFDVLIPEIQKIRDFLHFHETTVQFVCATVVDVVTAEKRKEIPSDSLLDTLIQVYNPLAKTN
jgi:hypothetical protein